VITFPTSVITIPKRVITMPKSLITIPKRPPDHVPEIGDHDAETGDHDGPLPAISGIALLFASLIAGVVWEQFGAPATFLSGAVLTAIGLIGGFSLRPPPAPPDRIATST
jgi:hypothetical protein